ncbi:MAG: arginyltransferase [Tepidisphaeraceae bacterium]
MDSRPINLAAGDLSSALAPPVDVRLVNTGDHACPYLPGRVANNRAFLAERIDPEIYHAFMDAGFRRSGRIVYQPACAACRACVPIRVPVATFVPSKSQRRCWRRNADLALHVEPARASDEKFDLYRRYNAARHGAEEVDRSAFESFLCDSPVDTLEFAYRDATGRLLAVGICDVSARSLSSVYFYFDPAAPKRGVGTYGVLQEIEFARGAGIPYYYLGYWVEPCRSMRYKADFRPCELLQPDGQWRVHDPSPGGERPLHESGSSGM